MINSAKKPEFIMTGDLESMKDFEIAFQKEGKVEPKGFHIRNAVQNQNASESQKKN